MARNKYPEKTVEKILDVSFQLFAQKGYEKTTIQDIVDALGMSKGAIYHHFKSKDDIMHALSLRSFVQRRSIDEANVQLNGLQKIKNFLYNEFQSNDKQVLDKMASSIIRVPQFLAMYLKTCIEENAVSFAAMVEEGIQDGSLHVKDAQMVSEIIMILCNIWMNPALWEREEDVFERQLNTLVIITEGLGLPVLDEDICKLILQYYKKVTAE